ncbi:DUF2750 domain-containing protein [Ferrimonas aestuarii]|uniref:DUF2750 domain-containing protein n=1 Tax=Ferrimonas aestuarii TaxID=2569539 RepID=A0A4U1BML1_9GAMM|nr:DUF2750 domain-containing protein [Ferrimonas aestuarii]TKB53968.1 DUF2750 domain-containing protein [Ferrimonas aestuarii]
MPFTQEQIDGFYRQTSQQRFAEFIEQVKQNQKLWTLANEQGCVLVDTGEEQCLVLWHDEALAQSWAVEDYQGCKAMAISLGDFLEKWAPGMTKDGFDIAVVPTRGGEGDVMSAEELANELAAD